MAKPDSDSKYRLAEKRVEVLTNSRYELSAFWEIATEEIENANKDLELKIDIAERLEKAAKKGEHEFQNTSMLMLP